jgi:DNA-binding MarR family transcriptional regulator
MHLPNDKPSASSPGVRAPHVGVAFLLSQVGAHAADDFAERLQAVELRPHEAGVLRILGSNPGLTQKALSELLGVLPSQLVVLLDALEGKALVERRNTPADRRRYQLHLTPAGRRALNTVARITKEMETHLLRALSRRERSDLLALLQRLSSAAKITAGVHPSYRRIAKR